MNIEEPKNILEIDSTNYQTNYTPKYLKRKGYVKHDPKQVTAYIPGIILKVFVREGSSVSKDSKLLLLEAMKMENKVVAPINGKIKYLHVKEGDIVAKNQLLVEFE